MDVDNAWYGSAPFLQVVLEINRFGRLSVAGRRRIDTADATIDVTGKLWNKYGLVAQ